MFATIVTVRIDHGREADALEMLRSRVVPMVKNSEGFVAGYWTEPRDGTGFSMVVFDTEDHARAAALPVGARPAGSPVVVDSVEFREVVASA